MEVSKYFGDEVRTRKCCFTKFQNFLQFPVCLWYWLHVICNSESIWITM